MAWRAGHPVASTSVHPPRSDRGPAIAAALVLAQAVAGPGPAIAQSRTPDRRLDNTLGRPEAPTIKTPGRLETPAIKVKPPDEANGRGDNDQLFRVRYPDLTVERTRALSAGAYEYYLKQLPLGVPAPATIFIIGPDARRELAECGGETRCTVTLRASAVYTIRVRASAPADFTTYIGPVSAPAQPTQLEAKRIHETKTPLAGRRDAPHP